MVLEYSSASVLQYFSKLIIRLSSRGADHDSPRSANKREVVTRRRWPCKAGGAILAWPSFESSNALCIVAETYHPQPICVDLTLLKTILSNHVCFVQ
jgi:hypothetical protein